MYTTETLLISLLATGYALAEPTQVIDTDFPDPAVIQTDDGYYAFGTQSNGVTVPVAKSDDFTSWTILDGTDALPGPFPSWVQGDNPQVWAPDVIQRDDGAFVMYYSGLSSEDNSKHCVGAATSESVEGPYTPEEDALACPLSEGGAIDASGFQDEAGTRYVVYKVDGNSLNSDGTYHPTPIMLQKLASDAVTPDGDPVEILDRDEADGPLVEAPSLVNIDGTYFLSFSSNMYDSLLYCVSYATASSVSGPYSKVQAPDAPLLVSGDGSDVGGLGGPGGADFVEDGSKMAFHAFLNGENIDDGRGVWVVGVSVEDGKIVLQ
ncbi:glycosyl hydrolase [Aspergillus egyptiacus]|nr:glycosyl hydrolase [Aspergillus egyptiacus]